METLVGAANDGMCPQALAREIGLKRNDVVYAEKKFGVRLPRSRGKYSGARSLRQTIGDMKPAAAIEHLLGIIETYIPPLEEVCGWFLPGVRLTPLQTRLVLALARHPGRLFSTEQIMLKLYGDLNTDAPSPKIVQVLICKVRPLIAPLGFSIETVYGHGVRMHVPDGIEFPWNRKDDA